MKIASGKLKKRFFLFFGLSVVALFTLIAITTVMQLRESVLVATRIAGMPILRRAAAFIDGDKYERLTQTLDPSDPFYVETQEKFRQLKEEAQTVFLYTMARYEGNVHRFILDAEDPDSEKFSSLGAEEDIGGYEKEYFLTYDTKTTQYSISSMGAWGLLISAYEPILNSKGDAVGIIGVDFEGDVYHQTTMLIVLHQIAFALLYIAIGLFFYFFFLKDLARQNEELFDISMRTGVASLSKNKGTAGDA